MAVKLVTSLLCISSIGQCCNLLLVASKVGYTDVYWCWVMEFS